MVSDEDLLRTAADPNVTRREREKALSAIQDLRVLNEIVADTRLEDWLRKKAIDEIKNRQDIRSLNKIVAATSYHNWVRLYAIECLGELFARQDLEAIAYESSCKPKIKRKAKAQLP
jgi:hypothetical protein